MSEIIILKNLNKNYPLIVASNIEDTTSTKSSIENTTKNIIGRADKSSVMLINHNSIFATYTKQNDMDSNGEVPNKLIVSLLKHSSIDEILQRLKTIDTTKYIKFNLIFGDKERVFMAYSYFHSKFICIEIKGNDNIFTDDMKFGIDSIVFNKNTKIHYKINSIKYDTDVKWNNVYKSIKELLRTNKSTNLTRFSTILAFKKSGLSKYKSIDRTKDKIYKDYYSKFIKGNSFTEEDKSEDDSIENNEILSTNKIQEVIETLT